MSKFQVDMDKLYNKLSKKVYKLSDVKDRLEKVAFDVVRFKDSNVEELWQIQSADDGDYIVALYNDEQKDVVKEASAKPWSVSLNKTSKELNVFYKGDFITKIASSSLGFAEKELPDLERILPNKLAANERLAKALLKGLSTQHRLELCKKHPELS